MVVLGRSKSQAVIFWISFFPLKTCWQYFLLKSFTARRPCLPNWWHASMSFAETSISTFSKSLAGTLIPATFKHSRLEYWALAQQNLSMLTSQSDSTSSIFLDRVSSLWSFFNHSFNYLTYSFTLNWFVFFLEIYEECY